MNKGLRIWVAKKSKLAKKAHSMKPEQIELCQFVDLQSSSFSRMNGKTKFTGHVKYHGLQLENRVYLLNGKYKLANARGSKIIKRYDSVPSWATDWMKNQYAARHRNS